MNIILNCIIAFYPTALVWSFIPTAYLQKVDSFGNSDILHFILRFIVFGIIFFISYKVADKYSSFGGRRGALSFIFGIISFVLLFLIAFYQILPGTDVYATPQLVNEYVLRLPYLFFAVLLPLIYLFFE